MRAELPFKRVVDNCWSATEATKFDDGRPLWMCSDVQRHYAVGRAKRIWLVAGSEKPKGKGLAVYSMTTICDGIGQNEGVVIFDKNKSRVKSRVGKWLAAQCEAGAYYVWVERL